MERVINIPFIDSAMSLDELESVLLHELDSLSEPESDDEQIFYGHQVSIANSVGLIKLLQLLQKQGLL